MKTQMEINHAAVVAAAATAAIADEELYSTELSYKCKN